MYQYIKSYFTLVASDSIEEDEILKLFKVAIKNSVREDDWKVASNIVHATEITTSLRESWCQRKGLFKGGDAKQYLVMKYGTLYHKLVQDILRNSNTKIENEKSIVVIRSGYTIRGRIDSLVEGKTILEFKTTLNSLPTVPDISYIQQAEIYQTLTELDEAWIIYLSPHKYDFNSRLFKIGRRVDRDSYYFDRFDKFYDYIRTDTLPPKELEYMYAKSNSYSDEEIYAMLSKKSEKV